MLPVEFRHRLGYLSSSTFIWQLLGLGKAPGDPPTKKKDAAKVAVKCDMCLDIDGGPACVRACPTGAAIRVHPSEVIDLVTGSGL